MTVSFFNFTEIFQVAMRYLIVGGVMWLSNYLVFAFWGIVSVKTGFYYRMAYLKAILRQEPAWFESFDILELPSRVSKECNMIQAAASEKIALIFQSLAMSLAGFTIAFFLGWKFALICLAIFPFFAIGLVMMGILMKAGTSAQVKAFNKAGAYAEQALNLMKIVVAFGQ
jgi:ATP-binding cassette, subfamily B (MDR/TAP), member 1